MHREREGGREKERETSDVYRHCLRALLIVVRGEESSATRVIPGKTRAR